MKKLTRKSREELDETRHMVHSKLYMENLIGQRVGLDHEITFDWYAGIIDKELTKHKPEDALR